MNRLPVDMPQPGRGAGAKDTRLPSQAEGGSLDLAARFAAILEHLSGSTAVQNGSEAAPGDRLSRQSENRAAAEHEDREQNSFSDRQAGEPTSDAPIAQSDSPLPPVSQPLFAKLPETALGAPWRSASAIALQHRPAGFHTHRLDGTGGQPTAIAGGAAHESVGPNVPGGPEPDPAAPDSPLFDITGSEEGGRPVPTRAAYPASPAQAPASHLDPEAVPDLVSAPGAYRTLNAAITHQETHFAPVLEAAAALGAFRRNAAAPWQAALPQPGKASADPSAMPADPASAIGDPLQRPGPVEQAVPAHSQASVRFPGDRPGWKDAAPGQDPPSANLRRDNGEMTARPEPVQGSEPTAAPNLPALPRNTVHALAGAIVSEAADMSRSEARPQPTLAPLSQPAAGPVRTLSLQLNPAELGAVTVSLRLTGRSIATTIRATSASTAQLLQKEQQNLADLLHQAGYAAELPAVEALRMDLPNGFTNGDAQRSSQSQASGELFSSDRRQDGSGSQDRPGGREGGSLYRQEGGKTDASDGSGARADDQYV